MLKKASLVSCIAILLSVPGTATASLISVTASGPDAASILPFVNAFRSVLGDPNNGNNPGPLAMGRREINWDGGGTATTVTLGQLAAFQNIRGALFDTPGLGFVQAPIDGLATLFGQPGYLDEFETFSPFRLFVPNGSNITDVFFFIPGTAGAVQAGVSGFGAIFTDVDLPNITSLQFFNSNNVLIGSLNAPVFNGGLSFVGGFFDAGEQIFRVRITTGNAALGVADTALTDVVGIDDLLYSEPQTVVPEPGTLGLLAIGLLGARAARRRSRQTRES